MNLKQIKTAFENAGYELIPSYKGRFQYGKRHAMVKAENAAKCLGDVVSLFAESASCFEEIVVFVNTLSEYRLLVPNLIAFTRIEWED